MDGGANQAARRELYADTLNDGATAAGDFKHMYYVIFCVQYSIFRSTALASIFSFSLNENVLGTSLECRG